MSVITDPTLSLLGIAVSFIAILFTFFKASRDDVKELEHRLTKLETCQTSLGFTEIDRKCLQELKVKSDIIWGIFETEFPKFIQRLTTPLHDTLLKKVSTLGLRSLTQQEFEDLDRFIADEYKQAISQEENEGRQMSLALFGAVVKFARDKGILTQDACGSTNK